MFLPVALHTLWRFPGTARSHLRFRECALDRPAFPLLPEPWPRERCSTASLSRGVFLPHDFIKACGLNSGLLELLIRSARFHSLVLANVAHQQDTVIFPETVKKLVDLLRAGKTGLVENIESLLAIVWVVACQIPLQRGGLNARLRELLRRTRRGSKILQPCSRVVRRLPGSRPQ